MVTEYVADIESWKPWQQEYRFGVFLIVPPDPLLSQVNALRARYAWSQSCQCDAHISLTIPLPRGLTERHWTELRSMAVGIKAFFIRCGPLKHYLPHPGICLDVSPQGEIDQLRAALESASCFRDAAPRRHPFSAHITIAEMISVEQTHAIMEELRDIAPRGTFACKEVLYLVPDALFSFTERGRLELAS